jgi:hypothetical protein
MTENENTPRHGASDRAYEEHWYWVMRTRALEQAAAAEADEAREADEADVVDVADAPVSRGR